MLKKLSILQICLTIASLSMKSIDATEIDHVQGDLITFNDNGAWCWYQDPRVIVDTTNNTLLISSVAAKEGADGETRNGDIDLVTYHLDNGQIDRFVLRKNLLTQDDHNVPALFIRPDGRYLAMYSRHNRDTYDYWRISKNPHDATTWDREQTFDWKSLKLDKNNVTYNNIFYLSAENLVYNFSRVINTDPTILTSSDQGSTWNYSGKLFTEKRLGYVNSYTKYASNGIDRIHFIATEHHPRNFDNNIYHGSLKNGVLYDSFDNIIYNNVFDKKSCSQTLLTKVFSTGTVVNGDVMTRAWTICLHLDKFGNPYGLISCRANDIPANTNFNDRRFFYIRFDGITWNVHHLAKAGGCLWQEEQDYTGIGDVDPADPNIVYISTTIDPNTEEALNKHEIFKGITTNGGASWSWNAITQNSSVDNLRPICVSWGDGNSALLWFRGTMTRSQHYNTAIVGLIIKN